MTDGIEPLLAQLAEPAPPPTLAASVMARIAREPDRTLFRTSVQTPAISRGERPAWAWTIVGLALVLGITMHRWLIGGSAPDIMSSRIGSGGLALLPVGESNVMLLGLGLWLFLIGLFAPLRGGRRI